MKKTVVVKFDCYFSKEGIVRFGQGGPKPRASASAGGVGQYPPKPIRASAEYDEGAVVSSSCTYNYGF